MRRPLPAALTVALLVLVPAAAGASSVTQISNPGAVNHPSCPGNPCSVVSRTTAIQVKTGAVHEPFTITQNGRLVAWSVTLAAPNTAQIHYFDSVEGGTARAGIAVLRPSGGVSFTLVAQSPIVHVQPLFGETGLFALARPIPVVKGEIVALTVPTWLPALSVGYADSTSWRASRSVAQCQHVGVSTMQTTTGSKRAYDCLYQAALINYGVTERSP